MVDDGETDSTDARALFRALGVADPSTVAIHDAASGDHMATTASTAPASAMQPARLFRLAAVAGGKHDEVAEGGKLLKAMLVPEQQYGLVAAGR